MSNFLPLIIYALVISFFSVYVFEDSNFIVLDSMGELNLFQKWIFFSLPLGLFIFFRILKGKEDAKRIGEKFCIYSQKKTNKKIWIHAASVGELMSIVPIIQKLEKNKKIKNILLSTSTTSSAKIFNKLKLKKTFHQFFPLDTEFLVEKFLNHWKPKAVFFIESEIWPNMILKIRERNIPLILLNARITKNSFNNWKNIISFSEKIFSNFIVGAIISCD